MSNTIHRQTEKPQTRAAAAQRPPAPPRDIKLSENARVVLEKRYLLRGPDGQPAETVAEMFWRVAYHVALAEEVWGGDVFATAAQYYDLLTSLKFFPNSPTFTGAGRRLSVFGELQTSAKGFLEAYVFFTALVFVRRRPLA
jgi:ribonucleotide reductase alpha subunit